MRKELGCNCGKGGFGDINLQEKKIKSFVSLLTTGLKRKRDEIFFCHFPTSRKDR